MLRAGGTLAQAHADSRPADETLVMALIHVRDTLRDAAGNLRGYDGCGLSLVNIAEDIAETARLVFKRMKKRAATAPRGRKIRL